MNRHAESRMADSGGRGFSLGLVCFFAAGSNALGAPDAPVMSPLPDQGLAIVRMFGALIFVIALFLCGVWLWRNWQRLLARSGQAPKLRILEAKALGARHTIYVVGFEADRWMLAASPGGVAVLAQLPPAERVEPAEVPLPHMPVFAQKLQQFLVRR